MIESISPGAIKQLHEEDYVGPFCIGDKKRNNIVYPANFNQKFKQLRIDLDKMWWMSVASKLRKSSENSAGRLDRRLCLELAVAIENGINGILPVSFEEARKAGDGGIQQRMALSREVCAVAYVLATEMHYVKDNFPIKKVLEHIRVTRRTWHRWRAIYDEAAKDFLFIHLCEGHVLDDLTRPWARLALWCSLGLGTEKQVQELHLAKGGRILQDRNGQEVWVFGSAPSAPDI